MGKAPREVERSVSASGKAPWAKSNRLARAAAGFEALEGRAAGGSQGYFFVERCCPRCPQGHPGVAAPGRCLTWGPAATLSVSALAARAQLASTTNPDGWPGAASNRAAFTDVVPKSIPRVTGREAMAAVTAQLRQVA